MVNATLPERTRPKVTPTGFGAQYRAVWGADPRAFVMFELKDGRVEVSDLFRGSQPAGSGGRMLAEALRGARISRPGILRITNILATQKSVAQLAGGSPASRTQLGRALSNALAELGGVPVRWDHGSHRGKLWIEVTAEYPEQVAAPVRYLWA